MSGKADQSFFIKPDGTIEVLNMFPEIDEWIASQAAMQNGIERPFITFHLDSRRYHRHLSREQVIGGLKFRLDAADFHSNP